MHSKVHHPVSLLSLHPIPLLVFLVASLALVPRVLLSMGWAPPTAATSELAI